MGNERIRVQTVDGSWWELDKHQDNRDPSIFKVYPVKGGKRRAGSMPVYIQEKDIRASYIADR